MLHVWSLSLVGGAAVSPFETQKKYGHKIQLNHTEPIVYQSKVRKVRIEWWFALLIVGGAVFLPLSFLAVLLWLVLQFRPCLGGVEFSSFFFCGVAITRWVFLLSLLLLLRGGGAPTPSSLFGWRCFPLHLWAVLLWVVLLSTTFASCVVASPPSFFLLLLALSLTQVGGAPSSPLVGGAALGRFLHLLLLGGAAFSTTFLGNAALGGAAFRCFHHSGGTVFLLLLLVLSSSSLWWCCLSPSPLWVALSSSSPLEWCCRFPCVTRFATT